MIPFRDNIPSTKFPFVTISLIIVNITIFIYEVLLGPHLEDFLFGFAVIPAKWLVMNSNPEITFFGTLGPYFSSVFLHGGWFHLIGNMWYLWIFGDNVEDRLGHLRFLFFYLFCGVISGLFHTLFSLKSILPCIGASGAIAGVLGAYMVSFPQARVLTLFPIFIFWQIVEVPAPVFLGLWFLMQFLSGLASITLTAGTGGIAWMAHVGGFISGIYFIRKMRYNRL
jgi:membrane associated rhomboid family serine protease